MLLPTLAFVGVVTFDRALQSGIEDYGYAHRFARLRGYYFRYAPELVDHDPGVRTVIWGLIRLWFGNSVRGKLAGIGQKEEAHAHP